MLGTGISVNKKLDLLQRNERQRNFSDVANRKIDILRKNLQNYVLTLINNLTVKRLTLEIHKNNIDISRITNKQYYKIILF